jgi:hypothetical protein
MSKKSTSNTLADMVDLSNRHTIRDIAHGLAERTWTEGQRKVDPPLKQSVRIALDAITASACNGNFGIRIFSGEDNYGHFSDAWFVLKSLGFNISNCQRSSAIMVYWGNRSTQL